jgi:hypothetical protein
MKIYYVRRFSGFVHRGHLLCVSLRLGLRRFYLSEEEAERLGLALVNAATKKERRR